MAVEDGLLRIHEEEQESGGEDDGVPGMSQERPRELHPLSAERLCVPAPALGEPGKLHKHLREHFHQGKESSAEEEGRTRQGARIPARQLRPGLLRRLGQLMIASLGNIE